MPQTWPDYASDLLNEAELEEKAELKEEVEKSATTV